VQSLRLLGIIGGVVLWSGLARAQSHGFAVDRFEPAERGSDWFAAESLDLRGNLRWVAGATLDYAHDPLVAYDSNGDVAARIVERQIFAHLGAALTLSDRFRVGLMVPVLLNSAGDSVTSGGSSYSPADGAGLGDIRFSADARILGKYGDPLTLVGGLWLFIPNGSTRNFASDGAFRMSPRVAVAGLLGHFAYAAKAGAQIRTSSDNFGGEPFGSEIQLTLASGYRLVDDKLLLGAEAVTSTVVSDSGGFFDREATPFELLFGGHYQQEQMSFGLGAGPGLTHGYGSPAVRVVASFEWRSAAPKGESL
jgi:hypothetical protein